MGTYNTYVLVTAHVHNSTQECVMSMVPGARRGVTVPIPFEMASFCLEHKAHIHQKPGNAPQLYSRTCDNFGFKSKNSTMASSMGK